MEHTKGKWYCRPFKNHHTQSIVYDENKEAICSVNWVKNEFIANAELIAKAPELLEQNKELLEALKELSEAVSFLDSVDSRTGTANAKANYLIKKAGR